MRTSHSPPHLRPAPLTRLRAPLRLPRRRRLRALDAECKSVPGAGVEANMDGVRVRLGSPQFVAGLGLHALPPELAFVADDVIVVALGDERGWIALFTFADPLRAHAGTVVQELIGMGKQVHLVSGDRPEIVAHVARELGIAACLGGVTPDEKLAYVQRLQQDGAVVAMIGDGVNDAAGMAAAHVSIAMGGGADITCGNSDVVVLSDRLDALLDGGAHGVRDLARDSAESGVGLRLQSGGDSACRLRPCIAVAGRHRHGREFLAGGCQCVAAAAPRAAAGDRARLRNRRTRTRRAWISFTCWCR